MADYSPYVPIPPWHPDAPELLRRAKESMDSDLLLRYKVNDLWRRLPHKIFLRSICGSGLLMATTLRAFFHDYSWRKVHHGFHGLPSSFNVIESFLKYDAEFSIF